MLQRVFQINRALSHKTIQNCMYSKPGTALNPERHIYMTHNLQNMYDEAIPIGTYENFHHRWIEHSREYVIPVQQVIYNHLKLAYPDNKMIVTSDTQLKEDNFYREWVDLGVRDFPSEREAILHKLSQEIIIKQSKFTWVKEQKARLTTSLNIMQADNLSSPYAFVLVYNELIWLLVRNSNLYSSHEVKGSNGPLYHKMMADLAPRQGIHSLRRNIQENGSVINRFMNFVHS